MRRGRSVWIGLLLLAACGGQAPSPDHETAPRPALSQVTAPGRHAEPEAPPIASVSPMHERKSLVSRGTSEPPAPIPYRAIGTEPFWAVTIKESTATLDRPDRRPLRFAVTRADDGRAVRYLGEGFALTLTEGPCSDGMSDAIWSDRAQLAFGEGTLKGCGGVREATD